MEDEKVEVEAAEDEDEFKTSKSSSWVVFYFNVLESTELFIVPLDDLDKQSYKAFTSNLPLISKHMEIFIKPVPNRALFPTSSFFCRICGHLLEMNSAFLRNYFVDQQLEQAQIENQNKKKVY
uniref:Uncharacterized protein n=1 Tax=Glossina pallidipes TaxID=7398 RepID=A0A1B0A7J7_GLOPL